MKHENLTKLLATSYVLYAKAQNYHWNVRGQNFISVHKFLEEIYSSKPEIIDEIAERIAQLGQKVSGTLKTYTEMSLISEGNKDLTMIEMMKDLVDSYKTVINFINKIIPEYQNDITTNDLLTRITVGYEKEKWLIESMIEA